MGGNPAAVTCPKCRHSNPPGTSHCLVCHTSLAPSDEQATQWLGQSWSAPVPSTSLPAPELLASGSVLGYRYEILQMLGQGGMGTVYKARDRELDRVVALKVIRPELAGHPNVLQRFKQELILARQVTHKNVVRIFDLGSSEGLKYITMEYIEGKDLGSLLEQRKFTAEESTRIIRQVARALDAAHGEGIVHRDLKPQNIMVDERGKVSVMDFGLARSMELPGMTQTGMMLGTPAYMSPEQAKGQPVDARSDLFALGIIFYEMLTGKLPFHADTVLGSLLKRTQEAPPPPASLNPEISQPLSSVAQKALAIDPAERHQSAAEFLQDLAAATGAAPGSYATTLPGAQFVTAAARRAIRRWEWIAVGACVLLVGVVAVGLLLRSRLGNGGPAIHKTVTVLIADLNNRTGDPVFDGTLEPMFNVALEGAGFISAFSRGDARKLLPHPTDKLDEQAARLVAVSQGISAIVSGSLSRRGAGYRLSVEVMDAVTGNSIANADAGVASKDQVLLAVPKLAAPIRKALGDTTPASVQLAAADTVTAGSLEAAHEFGVAQEQAFAGRWESALQSFEKATELDPNLGRAYGGMAMAYRNLRRQPEAEKYFKLAMEHVDRMTERERYRTRGAYYLTIGNYQNCIEEYTALLNQYPSDNAGRNNLALCYGRVRNMPKAVEEARQAVEASPKAAMQRMNYSLYASYAGDFQTGEREARAALQINPSYEKGYLTLAYAQLGQGHFSPAADTYRKLESISQTGASIAVSGLADIAVYEGRYRDAVRLLEDGAGAELAAKRYDSAAGKFAALAYTQLWRQQKGPGLTALEQALAASKAVKLRFLAGRLFAAAGEAARARQLAAELASALQPEPQAYAKLIAGEIAFRDKSYGQAIRAYIEANNLVDTWIGRFDLGQAYLEAGQLTEADSQFDRCIRRRGEALEIFVDDVPTYGYFPPVLYYQGRVREALKSAGFAESYRSYLSIRGQAGEDPLLSEIRRRAGH